MNTQTAIVTFDPNKAPGRRVSVAPNSITFQMATTGTITYTLNVMQERETETTPTVRFPSNPIQWVRKIDENGMDVATNYQPIDPPNGTMVSRTDNSTTVTAPGSSTETQTFRFYIIVQTMADGKFFGTDPTIIIMRPEE